MYLKYGNFTHVKNDPFVVIDSAAKFNSRGIVELLTYTWNIRGILHGDTQAELLANVALLEAAYQFKDGYDLVLYEDDQSTVFHQLPSSTALGGTRVTQPPKYPSSEGNEAGNFRTYEIQVQADYVNSNNNILDWQDELRVEQGGPRRVFLPTLVGPAQAQITQQQMTHRATQTGRAVGMFDYPPAAPPSFPSALLYPVVITRAAPRRVGNQFRDFVVSWQYQFESISPLNGLPAAV